MPTIRLEIVTAERLTYSDDVNVVVAPGVDGELGILPHHAPLMTMLQPGELRIKKDGEELYLAICGGFLEVRPDKVVVLADTCERAEDIDMERAEDARRRAEQRIREGSPDTDHARAQIALARAITRLKVGQKRRRREGPR